MSNFLYQDSIPRLPDRLDNRDKFSMYLMLDTRNFGQVIQWKYNLPLQRNFALYEKNIESFSRLCRIPDQGKSLVQFWLNIALETTSDRQQDWEPENRKQLALEHLASYFEANCYHAARTIYINSIERPWEEFLCLARVSIYDLNNLLKILAGYEASQGASLETYVQEVVIKTVKSATAVNKFSRWRLLCKTSDKELKEALQTAGQREPDISRCLFARKYFKQVYLMNKVKNPTRKAGQKWPDPDSEDFQAVAQCYNVEKSLAAAPHEVSAGSNINREQIQGWMEFCISALQNYPKSIIPSYSIEALQEVGHEVKSEQPQPAVKIEWQDVVETEDSGEDRQKLASKTDLALRRHLQTLKPEQHKILLLYYGAGFTQKQVTVSLGITQGSISRRLDTIKIKLLKALAEMAQPNQWVAQYVSGWLEKDYQTPHHSDLIQAALVKAIKELEPEEREVLQLCYGQHLDEQKVAARLGMNQAEVTAKIRAAKHKLQDDLINRLNTWIKEYIDQWLTSLYQSLLYSSNKVLDTALKNQTEPDNFENILNECLRSFFN